MGRCRDTGSLTLYIMHHKERPAWIDTGIWDPQPSPRHHYKERLGWVEKARLGKEVRKGQATRKDYR